MNEKNLNEGGETDPIPSERIKEAIEPKTEEEQHEVQEEFHMKALMEAEESRKKAQEEESKRIKEKEEGEKEFYMGAIQEAIGEATKEELIKETIDEEITNERIGDAEIDPNLKADFLEKHHDNIHKISADIIIAKAIDSLKKGEGVTPQTATEYLLREARFGREVERAIKAKQKEIEEEAMKKIEPIESSIIVKRLEDQTIAIKRNYISSSLLEKDPKTYTDHKKRFDDKWEARLEKAIAPIRKDAESRKERAAAQIRTLANNLFESITGMKKHERKVVKKNAVDIFKLAA